LSAQQIDLVLDLQTQALSALADNGTAFILRL